MKLDKLRDQLIKELPEGEPNLTVQFLKLLVCENTVLKEYFEFIQFQTGLTPKEILGE